MEHHYSKRKRSGKACDLCRIKKTKCDGKKPCSRCLSDNKICVFTEKRKAKEKHHPLGYIDLIETRLDLLTKALEKLVLLSLPHLQFLQDIINNSDPDPDQMVPINEIVSYLILKEGLLKNLPVEWEKGALIAANMSDIEEASRKFAQHKSEVNDNYEKNNRDDDNERERTSESEEDDSSPRKTNSIVLSNSVDDSPPFLMQNNSVSSLTFKFENQDLESPTTLTPNNSNNTVRRSRSFTASQQRSMSPSHQKLAKHNHVHKPQKPFSHSLSNSSTTNTFISNNGNEFHLFKNDYALESLPQTPDKETLLINSVPGTVNSLPNDSFFDPLPPLYDALPSSFQELPEVEDESELFLTLN